MNSIKTKYGVCKYDINALTPKIQELVVYNSYEDAFHAYLDGVAHHYGRTHTLPADLWYVFIEDDRVIQLEQFERHVKMGFIDLTPDSYA